MYSAYVVMTFMINGNENETGNEKQIKNLRHRDLSLDMDANILKHKMYLSIMMVIFIKQYLSNI